MFSSVIGGGPLYESDTDISSLCGGDEEFNQKTNKFTPLNHLQKNICCLNTCGVTFRKCNEICKKLGNKRYCNNTCDDIAQLCRFGCKNTKTIEDLALENSGCGDTVYYPVDKDCVIKNKDKIIDYCNSLCIPSETVDCGDYCSGSINKIIDQFPAFYGIETHLDQVDEYEKKSSGNKKYLILIVILILIFLFLAIQKIKKLYDHN
jgi:hypothetical protein